MGAKLFLLVSLAFISVYSQNSTNTTTVVLNTTLGYSTLGSITASYPCTAGQHFQSANLICSKCPDNFFVSADQQSCYCQPSYQTQDAKSLTATCTPCATGVASKDQKTCIACTGSCKCAGNQYLSLVGATYQCTNCPDGTFTEEGLIGVSTQSYYSCQPCPLKGQVWSVNKCECPVGQVAKGTFCVDQADYTAIVGTYNPETSDTVNYREVETGVSTTLGSDKTDPSNTFTTLLPESLFTCLKYQNIKQCQILSNLCVLQMYDPNAAPCKAIRTIQAKG